MKVSVIIPVYNAERYIVRCVESIVFGDYRDLEIILVDDRSTDGSWELCEKLSAGYDIVKSYRNDINRGVSFTRNTGLSYAGGKYVVFVDADDWVSSSYVGSLVEAIESCGDECMPICGLHFCDYVNDSSRDYLWGEKEEVSRECFFSLVDRFMLQQVWNKIFIREQIVKFNIQFDDKQTMGEDFQFVLDYIEQTGITSCLMLNKCLYYYVRATTGSLMSKFGQVEKENEYSRMLQLKRICGENSPHIQKAYNNALENLKRNYIYHACRNKKLSKKDVLTFIDNVMGDGMAASHYARQRKLLVKETLLESAIKIKKLPGRVSGRLMRQKRDAAAVSARKMLRAEEFTIISQNCIGGVFYHDMQKPFLSPTVNLYFTAKDFVRFAGNLQHYISQVPEMKWKETYPIGIIDDITIHFMHYSNCSEALEAWERRKQRIVWDKIIIISTDMEGFGDTEYELWRRLPYRKLLFTAKKEYSLTDDSVCCPQYAGNGCVADLIPNREFYKDNKLVELVNGIK